MGAPSQSASESIGADILNATLDTTTGTLLFQTGDAISGQVESDRVESWQHAGFCSIPSNPVAGQSACQGIIRRRGDIDVCTNTRDTRGQAIYGNLKAGETCIYAGGHDGNSQGRVLIKDDGSVTLLTTNDNTKTGKVVALKIAPDGFTFTSPWGSFKFDASGFHLKTKAGPRIDMGGLDLSTTGVPGAISGAVTGYFSVTSPKCSLKCGIVELGAGPTFATCLAAPSAALAPGSPLAGQPVLTGPTSQCATVKITTP